MAITGEDIAKSLLKLANDMLITLYTIRSPRAIDFHDRLYEIREQYDQMTQTSKEVKDDKI